MNNSNKTAMNKRALTSLFMVFSFILLPLSGIPLHFTRANESVGVLEQFLMSIHNTSSIIFIVALILHLSLNWNALMKYITAKAGEYFTFKKEMIIALITVLVIVGLISSHVFHIG